MARFPVSLTPKHVGRAVTNLLVDGFFRGATSVWRALPSARPEHVGVECFANVPYRSGGDPAHLLDVYRPARENGPLPAVLFLHGGSFRILSKDTHFMFATQFARAGYLCFNADYRLAPDHPFPAALEDAADAFRWIVENGARWGADLSRLVVAGESAGGNLTLALAVMTTFDRTELYAKRLYQLGVVPRAIAPMCGILQVSDPMRARGHRISSLSQSRINVLHEDYLEASATRELGLADPLCVVESGRPVRPFPPTFASVGGDDPLVEDSRRLETALHRLGVTCEAPVYPGMPHAFQALTFRAAAKAQWAELFAFLARAGC